MKTGPAPKAIAVLGSLFAVLGCILALYVALFVASTQAGKLNLSNPQAATNAVVKADSTNFVGVIRANAKYPDWQLFDSTNSDNAAIAIQVNSVSNFNQWRDYETQRRKDEREFNRLTRRMLLKILRYLNAESGE